MPGLTRRRLERLSYRGPRDEISADALGVLLTLLFVSEHDQPLPGRASLTQLFQGRADTPKRLTNAIQIIDRYEGPSLTSYTAMVDFAQQAGVLRRFNPAHVNASADLDRLEAQHLLQMATGDFAEEIVWLKGIISDVEVSKKPNRVAA